MSKTANGQKQNLTSKKVTIINTILAVCAIFVVVITTLWFTGWVKSTWGTLLITVYTFITVYCLYCLIVLKDTWRVVAALVSLIAGAVAWYIYYAGTYHYPY